MLEKLKIETIYQDFVNKVRLTDEEKEVLNRLLDKQKITKISIEMCICERSVKYIKKRLENLFNQYWQLELLKLIILLN